MRYLIVTFLVWMLWASFSTGGLSELKQINPEYAHPNKSVAFLMSKLKYSESNGYWDNYHVEQCSLYMPDWLKSEQCVRERISCEDKLPQENDLFGNGTHGDVFSDEFRMCWLEARPFFGPIQWLRGSRVFMRFGVASGFAWLAGGFSKKGDDYDDWENKHKGWLKPLMRWAEDAV